MSTEAERSAAAHLGELGYPSTTRGRIGEVGGVRLQGEIAAGVNNGKAEGTDWPPLICAVRSKRYGIELTVPSEDAQRLWRLGYEVREYVPKDFHDDRAYFREFGSWPDLAPAPPSSEGESARVEACEHCASKPGQFHLPGCPLSKVPPAKGEG